jgi:hypothetical protein
MLEKARTLGIRVAKNFAYFLDEDGVRRVKGTHGEDGEVHPAKGAVPELVIPRTWEWEDGYRYHIDGDGDLARWRALPELREADRSLPKLKEDRSSSRVNPTPKRYWVITGGEEPDAYVAPDREDVWSFYAGTAPEIAVGDALFVWIAKPFHCLVALAEVSSAPRDDEDGDLEVPLRFLTHTTERPLYRDDLLYDPILEKAAFLDPKSDAVTALDEAQALRLLRWMQHRNPATSSVCAVWAGNLARRLGSDDPFAPPDDYERAPVKPPAETIPAVSLTPGQEYRVLSVHPPWAWAIIHAAKDIENRTWTTPHRGPILIHASSKKYTGRALEEARTEISANSGLDLDRIPKDFPRSQIIGMVDVNDCIPNSRSRWAFKGQEHWVLGNPRRLDRPVTNVDGKLNLWTWRAP